ncbi:MAG: 3'-5' exonuclease [Flavobacteriales bacterium]|jgi:uncharacterized protein YprB with RNaseH-like and TPR domain
MAESRASIDEILFLDIETVSAERNWDDVPDNWKDLWEEKSAYFREKSGVMLADSYERAGIYAEFGKVVCIGVGFFHRTAGGQQLRVNAFYDDREEVVLQEFAEFLEKYTRNPFRVLCAHNGKEFDFPYLCRRMLIQGIALPSLLQIGGLKPWEVPHLDTLELWKFGDYKHYTSLKLLAAVMGVPDSKDDIDGSEVGRVYWKEGDLDRIARYCRKDVITLARVYQRLTGVRHTEHVEVHIVGE